MGDALSTQLLDEGTRRLVSERTQRCLDKLGRLYKQQYAVALFNSVRSQMAERSEPQPQLVPRKTPLKLQASWEGYVFQYLPSKKKWKEQYFVVQTDYQVAYYETKQAYKDGAEPSGVLWCAGFQVLPSLQKYQSLVAVSPNAEPKGKVSGSPLLHCPTPYAVYLLHPYREHVYLCTQTAERHSECHAALKDSIRHVNAAGVSEKVEVQALRESVRLYRQEGGEFGTWAMCTGTEVEILSNLVMEDVLPAVQTNLKSKLRGKPSDQLKAWIQVKDSIYGQVRNQVKPRYQALVKECAEGRPRVEGLVRSDLNEILACKEQLQRKIRAWVAPSAEPFWRSQVQQDLPTLLESLADPVGEGFSQLRVLFIGKTSEIIAEVKNGANNDQIGKLMSKLKVLPYNVVAMQPSYKNVEGLWEHKERLRQTFNFTTLDTLIDHAQRLMQQLLDSAVHTFEQLTHHNMSKGSGNALTSLLQKAQDRVLKKYDYDSSTVRKKFFQEALLQITFPCVLKKLAPTCKQGLGKYEEDVYTEYARVLFLPNIYEEALLQIVAPDIAKAIRAATNENKHKLFRDSVMIPADSEPNLLARLANEQTPWKAARFSAFNPQARSSDDLDREPGEIAIEEEEEEEESPENRSPVAASNTPSVMQKKEAVSASAGEFESEREKHRKVEIPQVVLHKAPSREQEGFDVSEDSVFDSDLKNGFDESPAVARRAASPKHQSPSKDTGTDAPTQTMTLLDQAEPKWHRNSDGDVSEILDALTVVRLPVEEFSDVGGPAVMRGGSRKKSSYRGSTEDAHTEVEVEYRSLQDNVDGKGGRDARSRDEQQENANVCNGFANASPALEKKDDGDDDEEEEANDSVF
ncbi:protein Niban 2-like [Lethenteron reissneri]|uniref:protein Niban 2-like n=1 Tax=Lethenteron reissneri TaxID=7753 RepID=UPI002AB60458|nr:protein Niban 2-like [Lethenteron reissneri]